MAKEQKISPVMQGNQKTTQVSASSILVGALIGVGFCITLTTLGGALSMSVSSETMLKPATLKIISLLCVLLLTMAFFIADFIASKVSHQQYRSDSILHSLGTWAVMSVLLFLLVSAAATVESIRSSVSAFRTPTFVTNIDPFAGTAVTSQKPDTRKKPAATVQDKKGDALMAMAWWISFSCLVLGSGASVAGGLLGRQRVLKIEK